MNFIKDLNLVRSFLLVIHEFKSNKGIDDAIRENQRPIVAR